MRKEWIAETLLALVTDRERAASTAGDLKEQAGVRGNFWFWSSVLHTIGALSWRSFAAAPFKLLWLGFRGSLLALLAAGVAALLAVIAGFVISGVLAFDPLNPTPKGLFLWTFYGLFSGVFVLCMFPVGRWVARRAPGREITAGLALIFMQFPLGALLQMIEGRYQPPPGDMLPLAAVNCAGLLANLAGSIHVRRKLSK